MARRTQDSWSNIPTELAGLVLGRLHAHVDRVRFTAVCPQWRSAARQIKLPPPLPLLALKDGDIFYSMPRGEPLHFAGSKTGYITTACGNWLVYRRLRDLLLLDPFSGATMTLPPPDSAHLPDEDEGEDSGDGHDSADEGEDSEVSHDSADAGDDSENGFAPSRVHLPDGNKGDDSRAGHDSADETEDSKDNHDSADEVDDCEEDSAPSNVHPANKNIVEDSRAGHDSTDEGEDSEDSHDYADEGNDSESTPSKVHLLDKDDGDGSRDSHGSADKGEDSEGSQDSADEGDDSEDDSVSTDTSEMLSMDVKHFEVIKLIMCSPNLIAALLKGNEHNRIAVCRPGGSKWSVAWDMSLWITDMAFYQGKLYVVDYLEDLLALDIKVDDKTGDPWISRIGRVINANQFDDDLTLKRMLYLVESSGSLLLVRRSIFHAHVHGDGQIHTFAGQCEPNLSIFEANFARSQWARVTTLADNQALFLGQCSRSVCMPQGDSPGNRVWFLDDYKEFHLWNQWPSSNLSSGTSSVANPKPFSPLPMISWRGSMVNSGAAWIFPAN